MSSIPDNIYTINNLGTSFWEEDGSIEFGGTRYTFNDLAEDNPQKLRELALEQFEKLTKEPSQPASNFKENYKILTNLNNVILQLTDRKVIQTGVILTKSKYESTENRNEIIHFLETDINESNVHEKLKLALKLHNPLFCKKCLDLISKAEGVSLSWEVDKPLEITIEGEDVDIDKINAYLEPLLKLAKEKELEFGFHLNPPNSIDMQKLIDFVGTYEEQIYTLDLRNIGHNLDNDSAKTLIKKCPNINHLFIKSNKIKDEALQALSNCTQLQTLEISRCYDLSELPSLDKLVELTNLEISWCENLNELPSFDKLVALTNLVISGCEKLNKLPSFDKLVALTNLEILWCGKLSELPSFDQLVALTNLVISRCNKLNKLPSLDKLVKLTILRI